MGEMVRGKELREGWTRGVFLERRRRNTRLRCDGGSDVCSSDLPPAPAAGGGGGTVTAAQCLFF